MKIKETLLFGILTLFLPGCSNASFSNTSITTESSLIKHKEYNEYYFLEPLGLEIYCWQVEENVWKSGLCESGSLDSAQYEFYLKYDFMISKKPCDLNIMKDILHYLLNANDNRENSIYIAKPFYFYEIPYPFDFEIFKTKNFIYDHFNFLCEQLELPINRIINAPENYL